MSPAGALRGAGAGRDDIQRALDRVTGARPIAGNALRHYPDSSAALAAMVALIAGARSSVHFENYIIRSDATGRRFADVLAERARAGVTVRLLYDAFGCRWTAGRLWRGLRHAGVEVRAFHPLLGSGPVALTRRSHRKLVVADGAIAMLGGVCIGDEWAGDAAHGRQPWRDTMVEVRGPAVAALDRTFGHVWGRAGAPLPDGALAPAGLPAGQSEVRVIEGEPGESRAYRLVQLLAAGVAERLWITDAYLVAPRPLFAAVCDAARAGVDVRVLLPQTSDVPVVRTLTRIGYRELLGAGVRIYEWGGPMLHAKTTLADRRWARIGSSNLNVSSLVANWELDLLADSIDLAEELAAQFRRDAGRSREIVRRPRPLRLPAKLVGAPAPAPAGPHRPSRRERSVAAVVALRQVAGGLRRALLASAASTLAALGLLLVAFPRTMTGVLAAGAFAVAFALAWYAVARRRGRDDRRPLEHDG